MSMMESTSSSKGTISDKRVVAALVASVTGSGRDALFSLPMPSRSRDMAFHLEDRRGNHNIVSESALENDANLVVQFCSLRPVPVESGRFPSRIGKFLL